MGVAGSGKTTVGAKLAHALGVEFIDGDDLHPPANVQRMAAGIPLTDADRDRKSTRLNSSHDQISYAVFCLKKKSPLARQGVVGCVPAAAVVDGQPARRA